MHGTLGAAGESVGPVLIGGDAFTFGMKGTGFTGTVSLWRASGKLANPASTDYRLVAEFTDDTEYTGQSTPAYYKATIETGDYTAGSAEIWIEE